jgi:hypothetical protein
VWPAAANDLKKSSVRPIDGLFAALATTRVTKLQTHQISSVSAARVHTSDCGRPIRAARQCRRKPLHEAARRQHRAGVGGMPGRRQGSYSGYLATCAGHPAGATQAWPRFDPAHDPNAPPARSRVLPTTWLDCRLRCHARGQEGTRAPVAHIVFCHVAEATSATRCDAPLTTIVNLTSVHIAPLEICISRLA